MHIYYELHTFIIYEIHNYSACFVVHISITHLYSSNVSIFSIYLCKVWQYCENVVILHPKRKFAKKWNYLMIRWCWWALSIWNWETSIAPLMHYARTCRFPERKSWRNWQKRDLSIIRRRISFGKLWRTKNIWHKNNWQWKRNKTTGVASSNINPKDSLWGDTENENGGAEPPFFGDDGIPWRMLYLRIIPWL